MKASRRLSRRSFVTSVLGGVVAGGATALIVGSARAQNIRYTGVTDSDTGEHADRPGYGTGVRSQYTDSDTGPNADAQFHGHGPNGQGTTSGTGSYGERASGCSDTDGGPGADPSGRGRSCNGQTPVQRYPPTETRHCTDSDRGSGADPVQAGVHC
jgi:hypothetical protein